MNSYYVYVMASSSNVLYIGVTNDLQRRVAEHKQNIVEGFTKEYLCHKLVYSETYSDVTQAIAREKYLKGKKRVFKEGLIESVNQHWKDLSEEWDQ